MKTFLAYLAILLLLHEPLIAQPGCTDTSFRVQYSSVNDYSIRDHIITSDNGAVLLGYINDNEDTLSKGLIIRIDNGGEIIWNKKIFNGVNSILLTNVLQMSDGTLVVAGTLRLAGTGQNILIAKLDAAGNLVWTKLFEQSSHFSPEDFLYFYSMSEGNNGDLLVAWYGQHIESPATVNDSSYAVISRLNSAGVPVWSKAFVSTNEIFTHPAGIYLQNNEIVVVGQVWDNAIPCAPPPIGLNPGLYFGMKLDETTGSLQLLKSYCYNEIPSSSNWGISGNDARRFFNGTRLNNNQYALSGITLGLTTQEYFYYYVTFDDMLNLIKARRFITPRIPGSYPRAFLQANGEMNIIMQGHNSYWASIDSNDHIKREKKLRMPDGITSNGFSSYANKSPDATTFIRRFNTGSNRYAEFVQLHWDDDSIDDCLGSDTAFVSTMPFTTTPVSWAWKYLIDNPINFSPADFSVATVPLLKENVCEQVSNCENIQISGQDTVCLSGTQKVFTVIRNPGCGKRIDWRIDSAAFTNLSYANDTTLHITFRMPASGADSVWLYASAGNCSFTNDSILIKLIPFSPPVAISNDDELCPGTSKKLTPGHGFKNYQWQDGSTDSVFFATQPGTYYVTMESYCGDIFSDTVRLYTPEIVTNHLYTKCNYDTVIMTAVPGFSNYNWEPSYNSIPVSGSSIGVFPEYSLYYKVSAVSSGGCVVTDSILVTVNHSPLVDLGSDTSFCTGTSINLNAGNNFSSWQWSDGATTPSIVVSQPGVYSVKARDDKGCISTDTISVLSLYPAPSLNIHDKTILCRGQHDTLVAGGTDWSYLWQDGSTGNHFQVTQPGTYWVQVTNSFGCTAWDTAVVTGIKDPPADFIFTDTMICPGATILLEPSAGFTGYHWSTGSNASSLAVTTPGNYQLQVTDVWGCSGSASVQVKDKDCINEIFFPSAFTPNHDGKNDMFLPYVSGILSHFELTVFNRWGQVVFRTKDYRTGWNGTINGQQQPTGVFIWVCTFQFNNEQWNRQKGAITLLR